ncbi:hypothetical protein H4S07_001738 [Coemansia furcata]|uniref:Uncharacterized protein n=1 Tax=Coemansia furcata TaxID=417177 RepID=A0ACC1LMU9_9FUNG|nr:hypothetical protein H4S07_001738 [Coemansia furcata]
MKTAQFVIATSIVLAALASAENTNKAADEASATQHANSSSENTNAKPLKDDKAKDTKDTKDAAKKVEGSSNAAEHNKQSKSNSKEAANTKDAKSAASPEANVATRQLALSGALVGAAAIIGSFI